MTTEQEQFWQGDFGNQYHDRNAGRIDANEYFFRPIIGQYAKKVCYPTSVIEFGAGTGDNLLALNRILPTAELAAVEINESAAKLMDAEHPTIKWVFRESMLTFSRPRRWDMAMTKGTLIHIEPKSLLAAYARLYAHSSKWILICEYYNPTPVEVEYRGHAGKLWKRDFAGELLDTYKDLKLVDYGFRYSRDQYPQDNIHYFLMEKQSV